MTTTYGWDASHFDGTLTTAVLAKAKAQGIAFFTHKLGEGTGNVDITAKTALAAAKAAAIPLIGGYWFCHNGDDPVAEADRMVARADADEPWWRTFPGWFWQADCETEAGSGKPSPGWIKKFADRLVSTTGRTCLVYASHGQYGDTLHGLGHPLWNANYPAGRASAFADLYPGNAFSGWSPYSGQTPVICQYTSSATIAGLTTCDANAFRGTLAELTAIIEGDDMPLSDSDITKIVTAVWNTDGTTPNYPWMGDAKTNAGIKAISAVKDGANEANAAHVGVDTANAALAAQAKQLAALTAAVTALSKGGTSIDTTTIVNAINAVGATEFTNVKALQAQVADYQAKLAAAGAALQ